VAFTTIGTPSESSTVVPPFSRVWRAVHSATDNVWGSLRHTSFVAMRAPQDGRQEWGDGESRGGSTRKEGRCACDDVREEHNINEIVITVLKR
jgi:hypothetical protein